MSRMPRTAHESRAFGEKYGACQLPNTTSHGFPQPARDLALRRLARGDRMIQSLLEERTRRWTPGFDDFETGAPRIATKENSARTFREDSNGRLRSRPSPVFGKELLSFAWLTISDLDTSRSGSGLSSFLRAAGSLGFGRSRCPTLPVGAMFPTIARSGSPRWKSCRGSQHRNTDHRASGPEGIGCSRQPEPRASNRAHGDVRTRVSAYGAPADLRRGSTVWLRWRAKRSNGILSSGIYPT